MLHVVAKGTNVLGRDGCKYDVLLSVTDGIAVSTAGKSSCKGRCSAASMSGVRQGQWLALVSVLVAGVVAYSCLGRGEVARTNLANSTVIENSRAGDRSRYTFVETGNSNAGQRMVVRELIRPGAPGFYPGKSGGPPSHTHCHQQECFSVLSGRFAYKLDGVDSEIGPGDPSACIPAGHPHNFWNANNSTALDIEITLTPAGDMEPFFKTYCGLAQDSPTGTLDGVSPLQMLVLFVAGDADMTDIPRPVWLVIKNVLVPVLRLFYQPFYEEYTGPL